MPSIQQSLNQALTSLGVMSRLSPGYEKRMEARDILGQAKSAAAGLEATAKGLNEPNKDYSETQLQDIEARTGELNRKIYNAKIRGKEGDPLSKYLSKELDKLPGQEQLAKTLTSIETRLKTLKDQRLGLEERKQIMQENKEAHRAKRIQEMKNTSAKAENREKALSSVLPKGGM